MSKPRGSHTMRVQLDEQTMTVRVQFLDENQERIDFDGVVTLRSATWLRDAIEGELEKARKVVGL